MAANNDSISAWSVAFVLAIGFGAYELFFAKASVAPVVSTTALNSSAATQVNTAGPVTTAFVPQPTTDPLPAPIASAAVKPTHRYGYRNGQDYGYVTAVSEEDRKRGVSAGDVVLYRYAGFYAGEDHLKYMSPTGSTVDYLRCARPCHAIEAQEPYGQLRLIAFNADSVSGAAFQDAANGFLKAERIQRIQPPPDATASPIHPETIVDAPRDGYAQPDSATTTNGV